MFSPRPARPARPTPAARFAAGAARYRPGRLARLPGAAASALLGAALCAACSHTPSTEPAAQANASAPATLAFSLAPEGHYDAPFPLDSRRRPNGAPDLHALPFRDTVSFVSKAADLLEAEGDGFSPVAAVSFRFDRAFDLVEGATDGVLKQRSSLESPVYLVDLTAGAGLATHPIRVRTSQMKDSARPAHLLQLRPQSGLVLTAGHTYAAVVKTSAARVPFAPSPVLSALLSGRVPTGADARRGRRHVAAYAPLARALPDLGLAAEDIAAATVFTVGNPQARMLRIVERVAHMEPPKLTFTAREERGDLIIVEGTAKMPLFQPGEPPFLFSGGEVKLDAEGAPIAVGSVDAPFVFAVPQTAKPGDALPLFFYLHGTGGKARQPVDRGRREHPKDTPDVETSLANLAAESGYATASVAGPYSPDRVGWRALDGYAAYAFTHPEAMRSSFEQMISEQVLFIGALTTAGVPARAVWPDAAKDAPALTFTFDKTVIGGQSLGSYLSGFVAAVYPKFGGVLLTGAGGSWLEFAFGPKDPVDLQGVLESLTLESGESLDRFHPAIHVFQHAVGGADNTLFVDRILRHPAPGARVPHVLVVEGHADIQVPTNLQRALVRALGVDMLGTDVGSTPGYRLEPALASAGLKQLKTSATLNRVIVGHGARTAVVVRHPEDGKLEGHYVAFQQERARKQMRQFFQAIAKGEAPVISDESGLEMPAVNHESSIAEAP